MSDLETRLRETLHEEAAPLTAPARLAEEMAARGARVRRRRRVAVAAACAVAVAVAVPLVRGITTSTRTVGPVAPSPSMSHSPRPSAPTTPVQPAKAWLATLPDGTPPSVPFLTGMTYHWSPEPGRHASYSVPNIVTNVFGPVDGGVMVSGPANSFGIATPGGAFRRLGKGSAFGMAASPDGRKVAVADTKAHEVRVYDARTGTQLAATRGHINLRWPSHRDARVVSWGPGGVYYGTGFFSSHERFWVWSPSSVTGPKRAVAALDKYGVGIDRAGYCTKLVTTVSVSDCLPIPRSAIDVTVSHDGRYVGYRTGSRAMWVAVLDTTTGETRRLTPLLPNSALTFAPGNLVWESGDRVLFVLTSEVLRRERSGGPNGGGSLGLETDSMVRCAADGGGCEVAVRDFTGPGGSFFPTLGLTPFFNY